MSDPTTGPGPGPDSPAAAPAPIPVAEPGSVSDSAQPVEAPAARPHDPVTPIEAAASSYPANLPPTQDMVGRMLGMVQRNARRWRRLLLLEALGLVIAIPLTYLWGAFLLDNIIHLGRFGRFTAFIVLVAGAAALAFSLLRRWRRQQLTEDQVALAMERRTPGGVQNRLINALQLARSTEAGDPGYREAAVEENYVRLQEIHVQQAAEMRPAIIRVGLAAAVILVGVGFWVVRPDNFINAGQRILNPLNDVKPLYRTELSVDPGNTEASGDVAITVKIKGTVPGTLTFLRSAGGISSSETITVIPSRDEETEVTYVMRDVMQTTTYAVMGGDFMSDNYRIEVPAVANLGLVKYTYHFPAYTNQPDHSAESATGDLEALAGTEAKLTFVLTQPVDEATLLVQHAGQRATGTGAAASSLVRGGQTQPGPTPAVASTVQRIHLDRAGDQEFTIPKLLFSDVLAYQIETRQGRHPAHLTQPCALHVRADQPPTVELSGLERQAEAMPDAILPLRVSATDDYGLIKVGLFYRKASDNVFSAPGTPGTAGIPGAPAGDGDSPTPNDEGWQAAETWDPNNGLDFRKQVDLSISSIGASEGDKYEIAARAMDNDPAKRDHWTTGTPYTLAIGGEGVLLQLQYMQILKTEADLKTLVAAEQQATVQAAEWTRKLDPTSGMNFDDPTNRTALATAAKDQTTAQDHLRLSAVKIAKDMVAQAGNLRVSVGMLAETEMAGAVRILDSVTSRDTRQGRMGAFGDARQTEDRTVRSLTEIVDQYVSFRQDWELANMIPFAKMLAEREGALRDESTKAAANAGSSSAAILQKAASRRQARLVDLIALAKTSFEGLGQRTLATDTILANAFTVASQSLVAPALTGAMQQAATLAEAGKWTEAAAQQNTAALALTAIHNALRKAQTEAAQKALADLAEKAKSDLEAQKEIEKLAAGGTDNPVDLPDKLKIEDIIHMREVAAGKGNGDDANNKTDMGDLADNQFGILQGQDKGVRQEYKNLKLASTPNNGIISFPNFSGRKGNKVNPFVQEKFEDLVGKLLDEAEGLEKKYDTYNLNAGWNINEAGDVGKQGGQLNSTAASAATGNMKPPTNDFGGISRSGRQGARAHGLVLADESANLRGRDKALEGSQRAPDQAGTMKEGHPGDEQKSVSSGLGGKKVESETTTFNTDDSGHFDNDTIKKMGKPKERFSIVERDDGPVDPHMGEMLRNLNSTQEQVIDRIKAVRKELKNLYLPTEHLDEAIEQLQNNLDALKDRPSNELFRIQILTLEKLRSGVMVFNAAHNDFQPGDLREQTVRGRILDDPARQTIPGYEDAVKHYYEMLSSQ